MATSNPHSLALYDEDAVRRQLAYYGRRAYDRGYVVANDGNMSARVGDDRFLITPTGSCLGELEPDTFVCVDGQGNPLDIDDAPPSAEHRMHLAIYPVRLDVNAILHAHPPHVVAITLAGRNLSDPLLPELLVNVGEVPTLPYTTPTSDDTANAVRNLVGDHAALILPRHGSVTLGPDIRSAYQALEQIEHSARVLTVAWQLGEVAPLPSAEVQRLLELRQWTLERDNAVAPRSGDS